MNIEEIRFQLEEVQQSLLENWQERKKLVSEIQNLKSGQAFDLDREVKIFSEFESILKTFEIEELLAFSLMMQAHVRTNTKYPNWFEGEHLNMEPAFIFERVNPVLLSMVRPDLFNKLELKEDFQNLL